jgi:hypothetical protein
MSKPKQPHNKNTPHKAHKNKAKKRIHIVDHKNPAMLITYKEKNKSKNRKKTIHSLSPSTAKSLLYFAFDD